MKGQPLLPFAVTAIIGILLMLTLSLVGLNQQAGEGEEEAQEEIVIDDPIAAGEELAGRSCIGCHGGDLEGLGGNPAINQLAGKYSEEEIVDIITGGIGTMPAQGQLQEAEAEAIAAYLLSISQ
ncbi:cytochrome c [Alkalihalobacillus sp. LMS39]|uniref:c-type cytochrome n=1 Tax=Alkalihalobacillus sp. LMS39 TaxID=2924032 RepID=UPI001FB21B94|nr:cytochrome c [Alkalihalobacillus sp. LMS39]UOE95688.1 cytochrome c [Alkalihalobacillus sp. LMS39]